MKVLLLINSLLCLRLITLPPLENRGSGIFLKNQDLNIKLEKATESNIMDMYVVVHDRKVLFYNKGSYHGFGYDEDNVTLKLSPISLGKINYFSQDNDDQQRLKIVRWGDLIKKNKLDDNEMSPLSKTFKSDMPHENTEYPDIIIKSHSSLKPADGENTGRKFRTISEKHIIEEENTPKIDHGVEIIGGYSNYDLDKKRYGDSKYERNRHRYSGEKSKIGDCLFSDKDCEWEKDDYYNKRRDDYSSIFKNLGEMLKHYQGQTKPDGQVRHSIKEDGAEDVPKKRLKEDIQSDSEMLNVKALDISISTVDKKDKTFVLKNASNLCVTYYQRKFIMTACTNSKKQIFKLVNAEDVVKKLNPRKLKKDKKNKTSKKETPDGYGDVIGVSEESDQANTPDPKDEIKDIMSKIKKGFPKKNKKSPQNKKSGDGKKKNKRKVESGPEGEDEDTSSSESESKEDESPEKEKKRPRKKKIHTRKKTPDESISQKPPRPEFEDSKSNSSPNYIPQQFNRPVQMNNQPPLRLEEYCRDLYNKSYGQINKLPPECRNLYGFKGPGNPVNLRTTIKVPIKTPRQPNLKMRVPQKYIQKPQPEQKSELDNINLKTPEQQNSNLIERLEKALGTDTFYS